jgi:hypothetical protein
MKSGGAGSNLSGTEAGQKKANAQFVTITGNARVTDYTTGMATGRMSLFVIMNK